MSCYFSYIVMGGSKTFVCDIACLKTLLHKVDVDRKEKADQMAVAMTTSLTRLLRFENKIFDNEMTYINDTLANDVKCTRSFVCNICKTVCGHDLIYKYTFNNTSLYCTMKCLETCLTAERVHTMLTINNIAKKIHELVMCGGGDIASKLIMHSNAVDAPGA